MTRLCAAALSSALLLTLPACAPSGQPAGSSASAEPEHLAFYDSFETWNQEVPSNSVQVEEVERDGLLQYRFWNEASGLELFVLPGWRDEAGPPHDPTAEAIYQGRSLTFEMPVLPMCSGGVLGHASLLLQDLTGGPHSRAHLPLRRRRHRRAARSGPGLRPGRHGGAGRPLGLQLCG